MNRAGLLALWALCLLASAYAALRMLYAIGANPERAWAQAVAYDRLANVAANGAANETISSRANRSRSEGRRWGCILCRILDWVRPNHCRDSAGK